MTIRERWEECPADYVVNALGECVPTDPGAEDTGALAEEPPGLAGEGGAGDGGGGGAEGRSGDTGGGEGPPPPPPSGADRGASDGPFADEPDGPPPPPEEGYGDPEGGAPAAEPPPPPPPPPPRPREGDDDPSVPPPEGPDLDRDIPRELEEGGSFALSPRQSIERARRRARRALREAIGILRTGLDARQRAVLRRWFPGAGAAELPQFLRILRGLHGALGEARMIYVPTNPPAGEFPDFEAELHDWALLLGDVQARAFLRAEDGSILPRADRYIAFYPAFKSYRYQTSVAVHEAAHYDDPGRFPDHSGGPSGYFDPYCFAGFVGELTGDYRSAPDALANCLSGAIHPGP